MSDSDDTKILKSALDRIAQSELETLDLGNAGTAFRFLTAYVAQLPGGQYILTGSQRMQQRPIRGLVDALRSLGAKISYIANEGFPPLYIQGSQLRGGLVTVDASQSSQFVSALMLIAPAIDQGLKIKPIGLTSASYVMMTLNLLRSLGVPARQESDSLFVVEQYQLPSMHVEVEADWASASFWYSILSMVKQGSLKLLKLKDSKLQGDQCIVQLYQPLGITTEFAEDYVVIRKTAEPSMSEIIRNLNSCPDVALPYMVTLMLKGIKFKLYGLEHLRYKESDRIAALAAEMAKLGIELKLHADGFLTWKGRLTLPQVVDFNAHGDHRIVMALAQVAALTEVQFDQPQVVSKSYPDFWQNFKKLY